MIKEYMKTKGLSNTNVAEQMFIQEKSNVSNEQVKQFIKENAENPQPKGKLQNNKKHL